jgi:oligopeptide/dipeptide ABC transporter ATP-binding protein
VSEPILSVDGLVTSFPDGRGGRLSVVDGISFQVSAGQVLALVGESGCGKSVTAFSIMRLVPKPGRIGPGHIRVCGKDVLSLRVSEMRRVRGSDVAMIFQEPMTSLNPVQTVGAQVVEAIRLHERVSVAEGLRRTAALFERVGIPDPEERLGAYPHELSGGLKQRVMIAMALSLRPRLLIADEPTTALDVTIQAQILELMRELQRDLGTAILLITHDLGVVNELADRIAVMYAGRIVEEAPRERLLSGPRHPYSQGLLRSIPSRAVRGERLAEIPGVVPSPDAWPEGCRFSTRCPWVEEPCRRETPERHAFAPDHVGFCHVAAREARS